MRLAPAIALAVAACAPNVDLVALGQKPDAGDLPKDAGVDTAVLPDTAPPPPPPRCSPIAISTITLIDSNWMLYSFDPAKPALALLGQPICKQKQPPPPAVSVAVEPNGNIWLTLSGGDPIIVDRAMNGCAKPPQQFIGADSLAFGRVTGLPDSQADDVYALFGGATLARLTTPALNIVDNWPVPPELMQQPPSPRVVATGDGNVFLAGTMTDFALAIEGVYPSGKLDSPREVKGVFAKDCPPTAVVPWKSDFLLVCDSGVQAFHPSTGIVDPPLPLKAINPIVGAGVSTCAWGP